MLRSVAIWCSKSISFQSNLTRSSRYRADIDGLRAVAVISVLFFHARILGCQGGFVGVDVFFVISGYLITSLIAEDIERGKFSLLSFYERRMRRIFPALFGTLFFCALAAAALLVPKDLRVFGESLTATTLFGSNLYFWHVSTPLGYFADTSKWQALLHTWSLSVEEQFYLLFPALLLLLARRAKERVNGCLWFLAAASFCLNVWVTRYRPVAGFYFFIPRSWELLIGVLLATKAVPGLRSRTWREIAGLLGMMLIIVAVLSLTESTRFPGFEALLPCLGAGLIIYAGENGPSFVKTVLSLRPLVFVGIISYSLYLWHWPLFAFGRYFSGGDLTRIETAGVLVCSVATAFLSFAFIERPFRGANSVVSRGQIFGFGLVASLSFAVFGSLMYLSHGWPERYSQRTRQVLDENVRRRNDYLETCGNWHVDIRSISDINFCHVGSQSSQKIMFWGDSHVGQLYPAIQTMYNHGDFNNESALFAIADGCLPAQRLNTIDSGGPAYCDSFSKFALIRAEEKDIDAVFIGFNTAWSYQDGIRCAVVDGRCVKTLSSKETGRLFLDELSEQIRTLKNLGKRVIVCLPFPMYDKSIPELEIRNAVFERFGLGGIAKDLTLPAVRGQIQFIATLEGAEVFDPRVSLCHGSDCVTQLNGISIYMDSNHIAASEISVLESNLVQVLGQRTQIARSFGH